MTNMFLCNFLLFIWFHGIENQLACIARGNAIRHAENLEEKPWQR